MDRLSVMHVYCLTVICGDFSLPRSGKVKGYTSKGK